METLFEIDIYDSSKGWEGVIGDPIAASFTPRHNGQGAGEIHLKDNDPMIDAVIAEGARCTVQYKGEHLLSGRLKDPRGSILPGGEVVVQLQGDWRRTSATLAWVRPNGPVAPTTLNAGDVSTLGQAQYPQGSGFDPTPGDSSEYNGTTEGQTGYYFWPDGSAAAGGALTQYAEDAMKRILRLNLTNRLGTNLYVYPDQGRGGDALAAGVLPRIRNQTVEEALAPLLEFSGLGLQIWQPQYATRLEAEVYVPNPDVYEIDTLSGIIESGGWSITDPTATRALIGGPGEDVARLFATVLADDAREDLYGEVIEIFINATGFSIDWPAAVAEALRVAKYFPLRPEVDPAVKTALAAYIIEAGEKGLFDGAAKAGVDVVIRETADFYFAGSGGFHLGDPMEVAIQHLAARDGSDDVFRISDRITEVTCSVNADEGHKIKPVVGQKKADVRRSQIRAITRTAAALRRLTSSR